MLPVYSLQTQRVSCHCCREQQRLWRWQMKTEGRSPLSALALSRYQTLGEQQLLLLLRQMDWMTRRLTLPLPTLLAREMVSGHCQTQTDCLRPWERWWAACSSRD